MPRYIRGHLGDRMRLDRSQLAESDNLILFPYTLYQRAYVECPRYSCGGSAAAIARVGAWVRSKKVCG